jgi:diguanylate cyclase (GGDEF)-like protein
VCTVVALAVAAGAILMVVRHFDTVQAEQSATAHARMLASTVLRQSLRASDFETVPAAARQAELDELFRTQVLVQGVLQASLVTDDGRITYSTDHRRFGRMIEDPEHVREALLGIVRGDVAAVDGGSGARKSLRTHAPVAVMGGSGVVVLYQDYEPIEQAAGATFLPVAGIFEGVLLLLLVALVPILRRVTHHARRQMEEIERRAHYDDLTGLPNRNLFRELGAEAVAEGDAPVVLVANLDRFQEINDALGHEAGDRLLRQVAIRLAELAEPHPAARLSGDEFAVLLTNVTAGQASVLAERIHLALERPFELEGFGIEIATSIGIARYGEHGDDVDTLLQHADVAVNVAKAARVGTAVYDPREHTSDAARLALAGDLRRALEQEELTVYFQPKAELATGRIVGVEALVRWSHPERGFIPPDEFIPIAERTGLVKPLTRYVLRAAVAQCRAWADEGLDLHVAVNLTIADLLDLDLPERIGVLLAEVGVAPDRLELEVTESSILADPYRVRHVLDRLNEMGVGLAIDDFGTGYSSLAYLKQLPVQTIKIDRSFVMELATSVSDAAIVRSTIDLARSLGLRVVAEGVETAEARDFLRAQGCQLAQGYLISRPVPAPELRALLEERARLVAA